MTTAHRAATDFAAATDFVEDDYRRDDPARCAWCGCRWPRKKTRVYPGRARVSSAVGGDVHLECSVERAMILEKHPPVENAVTLEQLVATRVPWLH